jgi:hypothetical protein
MSDLRTEKAATETARHSISDSDHSTKQRPDVVLNILSDGLKYDPKAATSETTQISGAMRRMHYATRIRLRNYLSYLDHEAGSITRQPRNEQMSDGISSRRKLHSFISPIQEIERDHHGIQTR